MDAGYASTPLWKKLGLKPGTSAQLVDAPDGWTVPNPPPEVRWLDESGSSADVVVAFYRTAVGVMPGLVDLGKRVYPNGAVWAAWPRKAAGHMSDIDENLLRNCALALGMVDVKVAALDVDWSGLKVVWRRENRRDWALTAKRP
ncbi:DUF3052 family protein [Naasia lichenicola]|uniref:DUF3052 family protein n=1 Tax=Naasia lichenicola TaxID=2565933 RepID=A0A4S4FFS4_9MICO|nr:DUF3052 family protein [Naasia lichenicola]THG28504.1 DUF3052 family protein [Naasia lichenicola]